MMVTVSVLLSVVVALSYFMGYAKTSLAIALVSASAIFGYRLVALGESLRSVGADVFGAVLLCIFAAVVVGMASRRETTA